MVKVFPKVHVDQDQTILTMNIIPIINKITWLPGLRELESRNLMIGEVLMYCESYVSVKINNFWRILQFLQMFYYLWTEAYILS